METPSRKNEAIGAIQAHAGKSDLGFARGPSRVLTILPEPQSALNCLDLGEQAALAVGATMNAVSVVADPMRMIASAEEVDLQLLREVREGAARARQDQTKLIFEEWKGMAPGREIVSLSDQCGDVAECVKSVSRGADMVVVPRSGNLDARDALHELLFASRKLVLVPSLAPSNIPLMRHIVVGWKTDPRVYASVAAAQDWLKAAEKVTVVCVNDTEGHAYTNADEYFSKLKIACEVVRFNSQSGSIEASLVDFVTNSQASCLLVGAFHHGYLVEMLLGQVTYYLLAHAPIPLMLKH